MRGLLWNVWKNCVRAVKLPTLDVPSRTPWAAPGPRIRRGRGDNVVEPRRRRRVERQRRRQQFHDEQHGSDGEDGRSPTGMSTADPLEGGREEHCTGQYHDHGEASGRPGQANDWHIAEKRPGPGTNVFSPATCTKGQGPRHQIAPRLQPTSATAAIRPPPTPALPRAPQDRRHVFEVAVRQRGQSETQAGENG